MKKACIVVSKTYQNNRLFDLDNDIINRDNCMYPFFLLKKAFAKHDIDLSTQDINSIEEAILVIYNEIGEVLPTKEDVHKSYLLLLENELIVPANWNIKNHRYFNKIFTWNDDFVDNKKYIKLNFSQNIPQHICKDLSKKKKLCTLIAGNKKIGHPLELYSQREKAIQWFEKNHPNDFSFYGMGWDKYYSSNRYINYFLNRFNLSKLFAPHYSSYGGKVDNKNEILMQYKFAICYENARDISGYISEKIFDCFFAGCIPVYWGAPNIGNHIPKECFIHFEDFDNYKALYDYLINMDNVTYLRYLNNIEVFLNSDNGYMFSSDFFSERIVETVLNEK